MIVRDEAESLPRCLASVSGVVDEIVVVDTGSTDSSAEICRAHGAKVLTHPWGGDFAEARNRGLIHATGRWILSLDGDEELPDATRDELRQTVREASAQGLQVVLRNLAPADELLAWQDDHYTRLFRNAPSHRYEGAIHEQVSTSILREGGRIDRTGLVVLHHGYERTTAQGSVERSHRNLAMLERAVREHPDDAYAWFQVGCTYKAMGMDEDAVDAFGYANSLDPEGKLDAGTRATMFVKLAQIALSRREFEVACEMAEAGLAARPGNALALQLFGLARIEMGDPAGALPVFEALLACVNLNPAMRRENERVRDALASMKG
jgi:tetratricopeptide (TPR) repeat protein